MYEVNSRHKWLMMYFDSPNAKFTFCFWQCQSRIKLHPKQTMQHTGIYQIKHKLISLNSQSTFICSLHRLCHNVKNLDDTFILCICLYTMSARFPVPHMEVGQSVWISSQSIASYFSVKYIQLNSWLIKQWSWSISEGFMGETLNHRHFYAWPWRCFKYSRIKTSL